MSEGPTKDEQRRLVKLRDETEEILQEMRREKLRGKPWDWREVNALLSLADYYTGPSRTTSGLEEQQRWFMKWREKLEREREERERQAG
jgi:hypothetical protein